MSEGDAVHHIVRLVVDQLQLDVLLVATYHLAGAIVVYVVCTEHRFVVVRTKRVEALQVRLESRCDVSEIDFSIDVDDCTGLFRTDIVGHILFESAGKFFYILHLHRKTCSIGMSTKVFQEVTTMFNCLIHVESRYGTSRTGSQIVGACQDYCRTVIDFRQTRCHDTDHSLVPFFVEDDDGTSVGEVFQIFHNLVGFFRHGLVQVLACLVVLVDLVGFLQSCREVLFYQ